MGGENGGGGRRRFAEAEELVLVERIYGQGRDVGRGRGGRAIALEHGVGGGERAGARWRRRNAINNVGGALREIGEGVVGGKGRERHLLAEGIQARLIGTIFRDQT